MLGRELACLQGAGASSEQYPSLLLLGDSTLFAGSRYRLACGMMCRAACASACFRHAWCCRFIWIGAGDQLTAVGWSAWTAWACRGERSAAAEHKSRRVRGGVPVGKSGGCNFLARQVSAGRVRCWTRVLLTFCAADVQAIQHEGAHHLLCFCQHAQTLAKNDVDTRRRHLLLACIPPLAQAAHSILCLRIAGMLLDRREALAWLLIVERGREVRLFLRFPHAFVRLVRILLGSC